MVANFGSILLAVRQTHPRGTLGLGIGSQPDLDPASETSNPTLLPDGAVVLRLDTIVPRHWIPPLGRASGTHSPLLPLRSTSRRSRRTAS